ncbi:MAG: glycosyltransferase family 61 protein [Clostridia bacterium]|nr:glycosyltransferase family 61 protein [Clostridia bacterium]
MVEAMSRLWYFLEDDKTVDKYVFFMEDGSEREIKGNYKEALVLLNIWDKLEIINKPTKYKEVVVPELGYKWKTYYSEKQKNVFETIFKNVKPNSSWKKYEKIYFTRKQLSKAGNLEFGGEVLDDFFEKNGYEVISPEKMTLSEMIFCIRNAEVCATLSGSLPHNLLFAQDGKKLIIVERCVLNNEIQVDVNRMKNLNVTYIDANFPIYTVNMSGPFIMAYNDKLQKFAKDNHMLPPDSKFLTSKHLNLCFKKYMENYRKEYNYRWYMDDWYVSYADYLWEAYKDGYKQFQDFLSGERPFKINHYFSWRYMKRFIRRALKRFL